MSSSSNYAQPVRRLSRTFFKSHKALATTCAAANFAGIAALITACAASSDTPSADAPAPIDAIQEPAPAMLGAPMQPHPGDVVGEPATVTPQAPTPEPPAPVPPAIEPVGTGKIEAPAPVVEPSAPLVDPAPPAPAPDPPAEPGAPEPPAEIPQSPEPAEPPPAEPIPAQRQPGNLKLLSYSLIGAERITGSPQCNNDGENCNFNYNRTARGYTHQTINAGNNVLRALAQEHGFEVVIYDGNQRDNVGEEFTGDNLNQYDAIVFNNPNGLGLSPEQRAAFQAYINQGGGYVGIHAGINCEKDWEWFHDFVGAFETGVDGNNRHALTVTSDISTDHLGDTWALTDEWHEHSRRADTQANVKVLLQRDGWPIAWYQEHSGGRMWYTGLGHNAPIFADERFALHLWGGIQWATGLTEGRQ